MAPDDNPFRVEPPNIRLDLSWPAALPAPPRRRRWALAVALAAGLAAGLVIGGLAGRYLANGAADSGAGPIVAGPGGAMTAAGPLAAALERQLTADQRANAPVAIGLSFLANDGGLCRTFVLRQQAEIAGLACRVRRGWRLRLVVSRTTPGDDTPAPVLEAVDQIIRGAPFDAAGEKAARDGGWMAR